ncbi:MAG: glycosyl hydrolase family 28-related protein, partial [Verrucomicrobiota bacterium]
MKCLTHPSILLLVLLSSLAGGWESTLYRQGWDPGETPFAITRGTPVFPGALNVSRKMIQDFSYAGYHRSERMLPKNDGPLIDATSSPFNAAGDGIADDTEAIQKALDSAGESGGGVVYLPPGTYRLTIPSNRDYALVINHNNLVLRGAGPDKTFLFNDTFEMHRKDILRVTAPGSEDLDRDWQTIRDSAAETAVSADLVYFRKTVPVESTEGFTVGDWVVIRSRLTDEFLREHFIHSLWGDWKEDIGDLVYYRQIEAVDEATGIITVDVPVRYYMLARDEPRLYHGTPHVEEVGLEDFSIGNREHPDWNEREALIDDAHKLDEDSAGFHAHKCTAIRYHLARNCWMNRVQSYRPPINQGDFHLLSNGVRLDSSARITIRDCHFQRPMYMGSGGNGYMFQILGQENLLMDCSARFARHPFMFSSFHCSGNVILRGASEEGGYRESSGKGSDHHAYLSQANLVDGTSVIRDFFKASYRSSGGPPLHGTCAVNSVFWNLRGLHYFSGRTYVVQSQQSRFGYVIGTRGYATRAWNNNSSGGDILYPLDHLEGIGLGDTLHPDSLFADQLSKRVGNDAPVIEIDNFELYQDVEAGDVLKIQATARDSDHGIESFQLYIDGHRMVDLPDTGELVFNWTEIPAGNHSLLAVATDKNGASAAQGFFVKATDRSPQIHYTFDATSSSIIAADVSGKNRHGRFRHNARRTVGRNGKGLYIPNDPSYLDLPEGTYGSEAGTVALAFKTNGDFEKEGFLFYGSDTVAGDGYGGKDEFHVSVDEDGFLRFFLRGDELGQEIEWVGDVGGFTD